MSLKNVILALAAAALFGPVASAQPAPRRNVVLIIADDLGLELGCYGNKVIHTPHIDSLAGNGVRFTQAFATVSSCSPSRASILTGLYTHQNGQYGLQHAAHAQQTHLWVKSLPNLLRVMGYWTGLVGKFHVGPSSVYDFHSLSTTGLAGNRDVAAMAKKAREFMARSEKRPFFLVYSFGDPHRAKKGFGNEAFAKDPAEVKYDPAKVVVPSFLPDTAEVRADLAEYYQSVARMDRGVGMLLDLLRETGQLDSTLIIFISDNGIPFPGAKTTLYGAGIHLPLIMSGPGLPRGRSNHNLVSYIDLAPTILDFTRAKGPSYKLPGKSLLPIAGQELARGFDAVFASHQFHEITMYYPMRAMRTARYSYIVNLAPQAEYPLAGDIWGSDTWQGIRKRGDKMMGQRSVQSFLHRPPEELYDLARDPNELVNLASDPAHAEALADLRIRMRQWRTQTNDPWLILDRK